MCCSGSGSKKIQKATNFQRFSQSASPEPGIFVEFDSQWGIQAFSNGCIFVCWEGLSTKATECETNLRQAGPFASDDMAVSVALHESTAGVFDVFGC